MGENSVFFFYLVFSLRDIFFPAGLCFFPQASPSGKKIVPWEKKCSLREKTALKKTPHFHPW
jgi:hypothetical protein